MKPEARGKGLVNPSPTTAHLLGRRGAQNPLDPSRHNVYNQPAVRDGRPVLHILGLRGFPESL